VKRSEQIILGAAGLIIVAAFWPKAEKPGDNGEPLVFATPQDCKAGGSFTAEECEAQWGKAAEAQLAAAPKFSTGTACEAEHGAGQCRPATWNNAAVFVPAMAGYMLARQSIGGPPVGQPLYPAQPCPPGVSTAQRPDCVAANRGNSGSSSSGTSSRSSGWSSEPSSSSSSRTYRTGGGQVVVPFSGGGGRVSPASGGSHTTARGGFGSTSHSVSSGG
jgi:uncharacterized protein YgiB involved in biofilm formation